MLYWLHGTGGGVAGIAPLARLFDETIESGRTPDVDQCFSTLATQEGRLLEGFAWVVTARRNPGLRDELLREVCSDDHEYFKAIGPWMIAASAAPHLASQRTLIRYAIGTRDDTLGLNRAFSARMRDLQIEHH